MDTLPEVEVPLPVRVVTGQPLADEPRPFATPRVFDDPLLPAAPAALESLRRQIESADLAAPAVVLPDFHHKSKMEVPSSVAVATVGTIRPTLTSSSVNCGMALIALDGVTPSPAAIDTFFRAVRERFPYPTRGRKELSTADVVETARDGAAFAAERFGAPDTDLERIEEGGRIDLEPYGGVDRLRRELPTLAWQLARLRFATVGPTNHFVELQVVEEVLDEPVAARLGVRTGQLTIQYHAGGGVLAGELGRLFGRRKDYPRHLRMLNAGLKPWFHLGSARSTEQLRQRMALYFAQGCPPVDRYSDEGQRLMLANAAAMNYGFAFRTATYAVLRSLAVQAFGGRPGALVVDSPHNSVYDEQVGDSNAVVHRHNSCRAYPASRMPAGTTFADTGQAVLLPGTHRTSSFLAVAADQAEASLYSACHGAGTVIGDLASRGLSGSDPQGRHTLRYRYDGAAPTRCLQLDDAGVDAALRILTTAGIVRPVARMRPIAVLH